MRREKESQRPEMAKSRTRVFFQMFSLFPGVANLCLCVKICQLIWPKCRRGPHTIIENNLRRRQKHSKGTAIKQAARSRGREVCLPQGYCNGMEFQLTSNNILNLRHTYFNCINVKSEFLHFDFLQNSKSLRLQYEHMQTLHFDISHIMDTLKSYFFLSSF